MYVYCNPKIKLYFSQIHLGCYHLSKTERILIIQLIHTLLYEISISIYRISKQKGASDGWCAPIGGNCNLFVRNSCIMII